MAAIPLVQPVHTFSLSSNPVNLVTRDEKGRGSNSSSMWESLNAIRVNSQVNSMYSGTNFTPRNSTPTTLSVSMPNSPTSPSGNLQTSLYNSLVATSYNTIQTTPVANSVRSSSSYWGGKDPKENNPNALIPQGSCLLKKLDPVTLIQHYFSDHPIDIVIPASKYQMVGTVAEHKVKIPTNTDADIYRESEGCGAHLACSTNRNAFVAFIKSNPERDCGTCCIWCRRNCSWQMMGIPTDLKPLKLSSTFGPQVNPRYEVPTELTTCCFECTLAELDQMVSVNAVDADPLFFHSRAIILYLFTLMYPGEELHPAPHYTLLQSNGGSLPAKEFFSGEHKWIRTGSVVPIPRQVVYIDGSTTVHT